MKVKLGTTSKRESLFCVTWLLFSDQDNRDCNRRYTINRFLEEDSCSKVTSAFMCWFSSNLECVLSLQHDMTWRDKTFRTCPLSDMTLDCHALSKRLRVISIHSQLKFPFMLQFWMLVLLFIPFFLKTVMHGKGLTSQTSAERSATFRESDHHNSERWSRRRRTTDKGN